MDCPNLIFDTSGLDPLDVTKSKPILEMVSRYMQLFWINMIAINCSDLHLRKPSKCI